MNRKLSMIFIGAVVLGACNNEPLVEGDRPDPMASELANAAPVELPPAIAASKTYRCKDNSLVHIDWLQGGQGANLRIGDSSTPTALRAAPPAAESGKPVEGLVAEGGYALKGDATATSVSLALPGKGAQACHV